MKIIKLLVGISTAVSLSFGGGDRAPVTVDAVEIPAGPSPFYIGITGGAIQVNNDFSKEEISATTVTLAAGYTYNEYITVEARYTLGVDTSYDAGNITPAVPDYDGDVSNIGIYLKPTYSFGEVGVYALLGYGKLYLSDLNGGDAAEEGFQWGAGLSYAITEHISVYAEYLSLYDDTGFDYVAQLDDVTAEAVNVGLTYRF